MWRQRNWQTSHIKEGKKIGESRKHICEIGQATSQVAAEAVVGLVNLLFLNEMDNQCLIQNSDIRFKVCYVTLCNSTEKNMLFREGKKEKNSLYLRLTEACASNKSTSSCLQWWYPLRRLCLWFYQRIHVRNYFFSFLIYQRKWFPSPNILKLLR